MLKQRESLLIILMISRVLSQLGNLTDLSKCKLSHFGLEYRGYMKKTASGVPCQAWDTQNPVHTVDDSFTDEKFSDFSKERAKNYCRNPNLHPDGPWCYSLDRNNVNESCEIPLCSFTECRATGPGMEYAGSHNRGSSDRKCLKWNKKRKKVRYKGNWTILEKYPAHKFPENDLSDAKNYCRNPSGDLGGPWCFVEVEGGDKVDEYCDIPFCEEQECTVLTKEVPVYSHFSAFDPSLKNFTFGIRLWDSDSFLNASAKLLLSLLALPMSSDKEINNLGVAFEIFISSQKTGLKWGNTGPTYFEELPQPLMSTKYSFFSINWDKGLITLSKEGESLKPIFFEEIQTKGNLLGYHKNSFNYYSAMGENIQWSFPFCDDDDVCDVHTTTSEYHQQFWQLGKSELGLELHFFVRAFHSGHILLVPSPAIKYPSIKLLFDKIDGFTEVLYYEYETTAPTTLVRYSLHEFLLDYWKWSEFTISLFSDSLQVFNTHQIGVRLIIDLHHESIKKMRWFSPASKENVAHWTFFCLPPKSANPPMAVLPECSLEDDDKNYKGTQDITSQGVPCLPWSAKIVPGKELFEEEEDMLRAKNFCRNPSKATESQSGSFCYTFSNNKTITKSYCGIRKCKSEECRLAGTGNDYVGKLDRTRSNRTCIPWKDTFMKGHINESLFADKKIEDAKNYCRNPTRNLAGSWCYTNDKTFKYDICNVKDCDQPEECIVIIRKKGEAPDIHILPQWKQETSSGGLHFSAKQWNPDQEIGLVFEFKSMDKYQSMKLVIGEEENEKVQMYYNSYLVMERTLSHLIHSGKWASFWLQVRKGEIALGYEDVQSALFEWTHDNKDSAFEPVFLSYMSLFLNPLGMLFNCDECHIENITNIHFLKLFPLGIRRKDKKDVYKDVHFKLRGTGAFCLLLSALPDSSFYHLLEINPKNFTISKINFQKVDKIKELKSETFNGPLITPEVWTEFNISFDEKFMNISIGKDFTFSFESLEPLVFYWFSVGSKTGWIVWVANCNPIDIDGPPLDGGWSKWSPWQCTVTCGGGEGFRTRQCNNPTPNMFGQLCHGSPRTTGTCNNFLCGDLSEETVEMIQNELKIVNTSIVVKEGDNVTIENNERIILKVLIEAPKAYLAWTLNGLLLKEKEHLIELKNNNTDIYIESATKKHVGTYIFFIQRLDKSKLVIRVVTLAVTSQNADIITRETLHIILHSKAVALANVYTDLSQKWLLNESTFEDYGITTIQSTSVLRIEPVNASHSGEWRCEIEQVELGLKWVTNILHVRVEKAPNFFTHLVEDKLTRWLFGRFKSEKSVKIAIILFVLLLTLFVSFCVVLYCVIMRRKKIKKPKKYKRNRRL